MKRFATFLGTVLVVSSAAADVAQDLSEARAKWNALGVTSYSFVYSGAGANIVPYPCIPYSMKSIVERGRPRTSTLLKGRGRCDIGGNPPSYWPWPRTIEELFSTVERLAAFGPDEVKLTVRFDPTTGVPTQFRAEKLQITDSDEGFDISEVKLGK